MLPGEGKLLQYNGNMRSPLEYHRGGTSRFRSPTFRIRPGIDPGIGHHEVLQVRLPQVFGVVHGTPNDTLEKSRSLVGVATEYLQSLIREFSANQVRKNANFSRADLCEPMFCSVGHGTVAYLTYFLSFQEQKDFYRLPFPP